MRRSTLLVLASLLGACTTSSTVPPASTPGPITPAPAPILSGISGLSQSEVIARFGAPSFQVREGSALKLQWQNGSCVLDAYLYPPASGSGTLTVLHADARRPGSGDDLPVETCIASLTPSLSPPSAAAR
jgi:hypothetical protein